LGKSDISLIIPTLNEAGNIGELIERARSVIEGLGVEYEILVMDGGSTDGTCEEAEQAGARAVREGGETYGTALRTGFSQARGEFVITMDSDLSHEPEFIRALWDRRDQAEVVIASRYVPGGQAEMSALRWALSRILNVVFTSLLRLPIRDISSGFRLYRGEGVRSIEIEARDFDVLEEILIKLHLGGNRMIEAPFHYRPRRHGKSHAKLIRFGLAYLRTLWRMLRLRRGK